MNKYFLISLLLIIPFIAFNQTDIERIDSLIESKNFDAKEPGISILVIDNNKAIYSKQIGFANKSKKIPISENTLFNLASISKQFIAFGILKLEEEGKLKITDSIQQYLPELPDYGKSIRIEHLLSHTSGIPDHMEILSLQGKFTFKTVTSEYMLNYLQKTPYLSFEPGTNFAYSNTGFMLLKEIVERVSNKSIEAFLKDEIFVPLEMNSASFKFKEKDGLIDQTKSYKLRKKHYKKQRDVKNALGATGLFCTLKDFAKWDNLFHQKDERFESIIEKMRTPFQLNNNNEIGYGKGIILTPYNGYLSEEHSGGWNHFLSQYRRFPELGYSILVSTNNYEVDVFSLCDEISDIITTKKASEFTELINKKIKTNQLKKFTGTYLCENNLFRKIRLKNDTLLITSSDTTHIIQKLSFVAHYAGNIYRFKDNNDDFINFTTWKNNKVSFFWEGGSYFRMERYYEKMLKTNTELLDNWKGKYKSENYKYKFLIKKNKKNQLILKPVFFISYPLESVGENTFNVKNTRIYIRFFENSLSLGNRRVYNLKLDKK